MIIDAARVLIPSVISFIIGIAMAPVLAHYLYTYQAWKKKGGKTGMGDGNGTPLFNELHREREVSTPRMGGIIVWGATLITALGITLLSIGFGKPFSSFDFVSRSQTWLPLVALMVGALAGLIDDILEVTRSTGGLSLRWRLLIVALMGAFSGWWFYAKLDVSSIGIPFWGQLHLGLFFIPFFILVTLALYAGGIIDGIDGLAGGIFAFIFMTYAGIAFAQEQFAPRGLRGHARRRALLLPLVQYPARPVLLIGDREHGADLSACGHRFSADTLGDGVGVAVLPIIALPLTVTVATSAPPGRLQSRLQEEALPHRAHTPPLRGSRLAGLQGGPCATGSSPSSRASSGWRSRC